MKKIAIKTAGLLFFLTLFIFPLGQLVRLPLNLPGLNIYVQDIMIGIIALIETLLLIKEGKKASKIKFFKHILTINIVLIFSWVINLHRWGIKESLIGLMYLVRWIAYSSLFLTAHRLSRFKKNIKSISIILILSGFAVSVLGLIQYLYIKDLRFLRYFSWDDHYYRLIGPFIDPAFTGIIICLGLLLTILKLKKNLVYYTIIFTNISAIFLTYSRSTYLALFSGLLLVGIEKKAIRKITPIVIVILIIIKLLPSQFGESTKLTRISTIFYRIDNYKSAVKIIKNNPVLGVGFNNVHLIKEEEGYFLKDKYLTNSRSGFDNSILSLWIMSGIAGVISLLVFGLKLIKNNFLAIFFIPILIHSLFSNTIFYPWAMIWFWILLGVFKDEK
jgi:hypothetical protein